VSQAIQRGERSLPFDWLLSKPHVGLAYAVEAYTERFRGFYEDIVVNVRGHPVSSRYPNVELFHHHDLLSDDPELRLAEKAKLERRAESFCQIVGGGQVDFLYCYPINRKQPGPQDIQQFEATVDQALALWPESTLHIYFMADSVDLLEAPRLTPRRRLVEYSYFRDQNVHKNWGTEPVFFRAIADCIDTSISTNYLLCTGNR